MTLLFWLLAFALGLLFGSFLQCAIYRLHHGLSFLTGRSLCDHCRKKIAWHDNIPVLSYLLLRGRCRACHQKITWEYPLVEMVSGLLFLLVAWHYYPLLLIAPNLVNCLLVFRAWLFAVILLSIFLYDLKYYLIPDVLVLPATAFALALNLITTALGDSSFHFLSTQFLNFLLAAFAAGGFFLFLFLVSKGQWIGGGDIRLGLLLGVLLGWPNILVALFLAYVVGALVGVVLIALKKKTLSSAVPFGTFLTAGAFVALLWGPWLIEQYLNFTF